MRHANEAAGSTSLYTQPVGMMEAVPLEGSVVTVASRDELEKRLEKALAELTPAKERKTRDKGRSGEAADYLCLFSRWYYRPQAKRVGEIVFASEDGKVPAKAVLRAVSRVYQKQVSGTRQFEEAIGIRNQGIVTREQGTGEGKQGPGTGNRGRVVARLGEKEHRRPRGSPAFGRTTSLLGWAIPGGRKTQPM